MAATYDYTTGGNTAVSNHGRLKTIEKTINLQDFVDAEKSGTALVANDVIKAIDIPIYHWVIAASLFVKTAESATMTMDLGDGDNVDGFVDGANIENVGTSITGIAEAYGADTAFGKTYAAADTIDVKCITIGAQTTHTGVIVVTVVVLDPTGSTGTSNVT